MLTFNSAAFDSIFPSQPCLPLLDTVQTSNTLSLIKYYNLSVACQMFYANPGGHVIAAPNTTSWSNITRQKAMAVKILTVFGILSARHEITALREGMSKKQGTHQL